MIQLSSPIEVTPRSCTVPRLKVQNSRIVLRSPISKRVGSPAYFLSCGTSPSEQNWKMRLSRPMRVCPRTTQLALDLDMQVQLVARHHRTLETGLIDTGKIEHVALRRFLILGLERQDAGRLGQRLHDQHARHHRMVRKMPDEEGFIDGDVFVGMNRLARLESDH